MAAFSRVPACRRRDASKALRRSLLRDGGYDAFGNQTRLIDPQGRETRFTFNAQNQQTSRTLPLGSRRGQESAWTDHDENVFDDFNAGLRGRFVSPDFISSQTDRIVQLALPNNAATRVALVDIPAGTTIFQGRVAPQTRLAPGLTGGAQQSFITGSLQSINFQEISP